MNELFIVLIVVVVSGIAYKLGEYISEKKNKPRTTNWVDEKGGEDTLNKGKNNRKK